MNGVIRQFFAIARERPPYRLAVVESIESRLLLSSAGATLHPASNNLISTPAIHTQLVLTQAKVTPADDGEGDLPASAPRITPSVNASVAAGAVLKYQVIASGNPAPVIHLTNGPAGMTIRKGVLTWAPTSKDIGVHRISVLAKNALGRSRKSFTITVTTDLTPPSSPGLSLATVTSTNSLPLTWVPSTDNVGVAGYRVFAFTPAKYKGHSGRDGGFRLVSPAKYTLIADHLTSNSHTVTGLSPGAASEYVVAAYDAAGNQSAYSNVVVGATLIGPSLSYSSNGSNTNPAVSVAVGQSLYLTLSGTGNPSPTLSFKSAPAGVIFTPGVITNSQLTFVVPHLTWTPTAGQVGTQEIAMLASNSVDTFSLVIKVTVTAS